MFRLYLLIVTSVNVTNLQESVHQYHLFSFLKLSPGNNKKQYSYGDIQQNGLHFYFSTYNQH